MNLLNSILICVLVQICNLKFAASRFNSVPSLRNALAICGTDFNTYESMSVFNEAKKWRPGLKIFQYGICPVSCTLDAPLCGSDGKTYKNICHLTLAAKRKSPDFHWVHGGRCVKNNTQMFDIKAHLKTMLAFLNKNGLTITKIKPKHKPTKYQSNESDKSSSESSYERDRSPMATGKADNSRKFNGNSSKITDVKKVKVPKADKSTKDTGISKKSTGNPTNSNVVIGQNKTTEVTDNSIKITEVTGNSSITAAVTSSSDKLSEVTGNSTLITAATGSPDKLTEVTGNSSITLVTGSPDKLTEVTGNSSITLVTGSPDKLTEVTGNSSITLVTGSLDKLTDVSGNSTQVTSSPGNLTAVTGNPGEATSKKGA